MTMKARRGVETGEINSGVQELTYIGAGRERLNY